MELDEIKSTGTWGEEAGKLNSNFNKVKLYDEETRSMITTPDVKYVTVVANAMTTDVTDLLPETGDADTIYRVGEWDGEEWNENAYSEYAWNGTEYRFLDTKEYGIDTKPIEDSLNMVTSGGIFENCVEADEIVGDPAGDWQPSTAEAYVDNRVAEERTRAMTAEASLKALYNALAQSDIIPVADHTAVSSPATNTIYREQGTTSYADWMYYDGAWYKMAEYDNAIDDVPTVGSENLVKSGGVSEYYGNYVENPKWLRVVTDNNGRIICGIKSDGSIEWEIGVPTPVKDYIDRNIQIGFYEENSGEWILVVVDTDDKILAGIKTDGTIDISGLQTNGELVDYYGYPSDSILTYWNATKNIDIRKQMIKNSDFNALFFSDIHGSDNRFKRIIALGNDWKSALDCIIDGGDDTQNFQNTTPLDWYAASVVDSELPVVRAVGNHDAWTSDYWVWATAQQVYEYFTAPTVAQLIASGANVVQPSDAATAYRNYYYVDFGDIIVIVLLSLTYINSNQYYDNDQDTWFKSVLADAITNEKAVICVNHGPLNPTTSDEVKSNWYSWKKWTTLADNQHVDDVAVSAIESFIEDGGTFICWLSGHTHIDYVLTSKNTAHKQFCFTTACAKGSTSDGAQPSSVNSVGYDLFNMISVDLTNHFVKLWRIGFNNNAGMQEHNTLCWDFANETLISEN